MYAAKNNRRSEEALHSCVLSCVLTRFHFLSSNAGLQKAAQELQEPTPILTVP